MEKDSSILFSGIKFNRKKIASDSSRFKEKKDSEDNVEKPTFIENDYRATEEGTTSRVDEKRKRKASQTDPVEGFSMFKSSKIKPGDQTCYQNGDEILQGNKEYHQRLEVMGSSVITPEDVLETLMNDGTIDSIRMKIINQLKANVELKNNAIKMAEQSKVLNTPGAEKQTKRELFDALRQELEGAVLEKASRSVWELISDQNGLGKEISETVEKVFCQLSGREPPLFLLPGTETQSCKEKEATSSSLSKKMVSSEMNVDAVDETAQELSSGPIMPSNVTMTLSPNSRK